MRFSLCPFREHLTCDSLLFHTESSGLRVKHYVYGLGDTEAQIFQRNGHGSARLTMICVQARIEAQLPFRDFVVLAGRELRNRLFIRPLRNGSGGDVDGVGRGATCTKELDYVAFEHAPEHIAC